MGDFESDLLAEGTARGRGALTNRAGRFERHGRKRFEDDWPREAEATIRTQVGQDRSRSIIARNTSPDVGFDRSINPYRGCEHGCIYCFARPTHAYLGLSPGIDFETRILAKPQAAELLRKALARPRYRVAPIAIGTNTDPYQPVERQMRLMRDVLEVLQAHRHPVSITTKGALIGRDINILGEMAAARLTQVGISLTTLDTRLSRRMEPRAAAPAHRLRAIEELSRAGVPVRAMIAPIIPGLTDHEMEALVQAAARAGARAASYIVLRLPLEVSELFREWLNDAEPTRARKVMRKIRAMHGGKDYDPQWGRRMTGEGADAELLAQRFDLALRRNGLVRDLPGLRCDLFRVPHGAEDPQLSLF